MGCPADFRKLYESIAELRDTARGAAVIVAWSRGPKLPMYVPLESDVFPMFGTKAQPVVRDAEMPMYLCIYRDAIRRTLMGWTASE